MMQHGPRENLPDSARRLEDSRSTRRITIDAEVQLRRSGELNFVVHAYDLSERGCKVEFVERPRCEEIVWVKFPGLVSIEATVRWIGEYVLGLEFNSRSTRACFTFSSIS